MNNYFALNFKSINNIDSVTFSELKAIAYERYKFDWLLAHGYSLSDILNTCKNILDDDCNDLLQTFEDVGINNTGELYACYEEFLEYEFTDIMYMKSLLTEKQFWLYTKYVPTCYISAYKSGKRIIKEDGFNV